MSGAGNASSRRTISGICVLLSALVFAVFGQTLTHQFVDYDDSIYVYDNPDVVHGVSANGIVAAFTGRTGGLWTPLVTLSHTLDCQLYGLWPGGHHLTNVLLHLASVLLLFFVLREMTGAIWRSAFVAALFAIHPLQVESVAWVSERKDMLSGLFFMLTLGTYVRYAHRPDSWGRYGWMLFFFACGLMSKPMLVTVPLVLLLLDYWPLGRLFLPSNGAGWPRVHWHVLLEKLPLFIASAAMGASMLIARKEAAAGLDLSSFDLIPFRERLLEAPVWIITYIGQMFWPMHLAVIYTHPEKALPWAFPAVLALLAITAGAFLVRKRHPWLIVGWFWNVIMLAPVLGILQISRHEHADHYNYLPQIGLYVGLAWMAAEWAGEKKTRRLALTYLGGASVSALMAIAFCQTSYWRDSIALWTHTLNCTKDNYITLNNLGNALQDKGRTDEAIERYRETIHVRPDFAQAYYNLGNALQSQGKYAEAAVEFREAIRLKPNYPDAHNNLGISLSKRGFVDEGIAEYRAAIRDNPGYAEAHYNLGLAWINLGKLDEGVAESREAARLKPDYTDAQSNLGIALCKLGRAEEGIVHLREAIRISPESAKAHNNLGVAFHGLGRDKEAIAEYRSSLQINPNAPDVYLNLSTALQSNGQLAEAIAELQKALGLLPDDTVLENNLAWLLATASPASLRDGTRAVTLAEKASAASGNKNPAILDTLAAAYAETGDFTRALQTARAALTLAEAASNAALAESLRKEIKLYEVGQK